MYFSQSALPRHPSIMNQMTKKFIRMFAGLGALIVLSLFSSIADASCPGTLDVQGPAAINFDPSLPVGALLWRGIVSTNEFSTHTCPSITNPIEIAEGLGGQIGNNSLYYSGIPGIGVRMALDNGSSYCLGPNWWPVTCQRQGTPVPGISGHKLIIELRKTGNIPSDGGQLSGPFAQLRLSSMPIFLYRWTPAVIVRPTPPTCMIKTPSQTVYLGGIPSTVFTGLNSTSASTPLNIGLSCSGAAMGGVATVRVTLTDATNPANRSTSLSLSGTSTASGISIQVLKNGQVLSYGPASNANNNTNQWLAGTTGNGVFNIPLTARYVQTGATVTGGSANGLMTFTMNYQ